MVAAFAPGLLVPVLLHDDGLAAGLGEVLGSRNQGHFLGASISLEQMERKFSSGVKASTTAFASPRD
jgi:hypothetical protein